MRTAKRNFLLSPVLVLLCLIWMSCDKTAKPVVEPEEEEVTQDPPKPEPDPEPESGDLTITSVSGSLVHGGTFTVNGTDLSTQQPSDLLIWDDFENGTHNADLAHGWQAFVELPGAKYRNDDVYSGNLAAFNEIGTHGGGFSTSYREFPATDEAYVSYLFKFTVTGDNYGVMKLSRLTSDYRGSVSHTPNYNGPGDLAIGYQAHANWTYASYNSGESPKPLTSKTLSPSPLSANNWIRVEMYRKLSTPGVADGDAYWAFNGKEFRHPGQVAGQMQTRDADFSFKTNSFILGLMVANRQNDGHFKMYIDDVYVSTSRKRVEIGNASTFATSTLREIQIPSNWTNTSIQLKLNKGRLPSGTAYLYVIDEDGVANEVGYPITLL